MTRQGGTPGSRSGRSTAVAVLVSVALLAVLGALAALVAWPRHEASSTPQATAAPATGKAAEFARRVDDLDDARDFDMFVADHVGDRIRLDVMFATASGVIGDVDADGPDRSFVLGDHQCDPTAGTDCNATSYQLSALGEERAADRFGPADDQGAGYQLRGTYLVTGSGVRAGLYWASLQPAGA
jgi:hypothetical protein